MRTRKDIETDSKKFVNNSALQVEVLLDIRDILIKSNKVTGKKKRECVK